MSETEKLLAREAESAPGKKRVDRSESVAESYAAAYEAEGSARREALRGARSSVYLYQFLGSAGWGIWNTVYTYYLMEVGGYSSTTAANYATGEWVAYALCQFFTTPVWGAVSDDVGRRPLLLGGAVLGSACMVTYAYPVGWWWVVTGGVQGSIDCTWAVCNAIIVDCVSYGAVPGSADDWAVARAFRYVLMPARSSSSLDEDVRQELAAAMTMLWCIGGAGSLFGYGLGYVAWLLLPHWLAMMSCGFAVWPAILYACLHLVETKPDTAPGAPPPPKVESLGDAADVVSKGIAAQAEAMPMLTRDRRCCLLTASYFMIYVVLTGIFDLCLFWGERKFDWNVGVTTGFLVILTIAPAFGAFLGTRVLYPSPLKYANSICLLLVLSAGGSFLEGLVPDSTAAVAIVPLASFGWGVYPSITALLTPDEAHANQGHLQGALFAITTLGSVVALGAYLLVYDMTIPSADSGTRAARYDFEFGAIWYLSALLLAAAGVCAFAAGDAPAQAAAAVPVDDKQEVAASFQEETKEL